MPIGDVLPIIKHPLAVYFCLVRGRKVLPPQSEMIMESIIVSTVALLLFIYLLVAMLWPEKF